MVLAAVLFIGVGLHLTGRVPFAASRPPAPEVGAPAPDFELDEVGTGKRIRLSELRDKPVVLNFWCGCELCRGVAVQWSDSADKLPDAHMIAVFGDHSAYSPVAVKDFKWGTGWEGSVLADIGTKTGLLYKSIDCPRCFVIDTHGIIRSVNKDRLDPPDTIVNGAIAAVRALTKR
jgi:peroxiredoxin